MRSKGFAGPLCFPPQHNSAIVVLKLEPIETRQYSTDLAADRLIASYVMSLQSVKHGRQIPAVAAECAVIRYIPSLFEVGVVGGVMELIDRYVTQKIDDHRRR